MLMKVVSAKYLNTEGVAVRYLIDKRSVQRRVKLGLLPPPYYFGTRFPRWGIEELDANDRRIAALRVPNLGAIAAAEKRTAAAKAEDKTDTEIESAGERPRNRVIRHIDRNNTTRSSRAAAR
jgi:hypothetical protein